jgi:hypothetical protein
MSHYTHTYPPDDRSVWLKHVNEFIRKCELSDNAISNKLKWLSITRKVAAPV